MRKAIIMLLVTFPFSSFGHGLASGPEGVTDRVIEFPDTANYQTLTVDLHTHSVFSDGHVWPRIRVGEALRDGLDALAVTEHLEWQPHLADIPHPDRNRAYEDAMQAVGVQDLLIIPGSEITREAPVGHMNAVFIKDANKLLKAPNPSADASDTRAYYNHAGEWSAQEAVQAANDQGAFVFWNHPYWTAQNPDGIAKIPEFHRRNARANLLHGIEIANGDTYSEEAFAIALKHDLTLIGVSDVHNLIDWDYEPHNGGHRPVTLVLANERSLDGIREALFAQRTVVWFKNELYARPAEMNELLASSINVVSANWRGDTSVMVVRIHNRTDATFLLRNLSRYTFMESSDIFSLPAHKTTTMQIKPGKRVDGIDVKFEVLNALIAPDTLSFSP